MSIDALIYRAAARALAATVLRSPDISAACARRSAASGEARFPYSDLDFDLLIESDRGSTIARVARRYRLARVLFPRTGQCFVLTAGDLPVVAALEPYRASINRRCGFAARGPLPDWPASPLTPRELARRVVFWLDEYFPAAVRTDHRRNQRKFRLEMYNALGVLEGHWSEPRVTLREVADVYGEEDGRTRFGSGLEAARRALAILGVEAPAVESVVELNGLTILPSSTTPWPRASRGVVATPEALVLLLQTQRPTLWIEHGVALSALGFTPPSRDAWIGAARRLASPQWARGPGFFERLAPLPLWRILVAEQLVEAVECGRAPGPLPVPAGALAPSVAYYYRHVYDGLASRARSILERLSSAGATALPPQSTQVARPRA